MEFLVLWLIVACLIIWINISRAKKYNRSVTGWAIAGFLFGILSTIVLLLLGKKSKN